MSQEFVKKSIITNKIDDQLIRDAIFPEVKKNLKIKRKFMNYEFNFKNTVKDRDNMIEPTRLDKEVCKTKNKINSHYQKEFFKTARCTNKFFSQKIIELRSNNEINSKTLR